MDSTSRFTEKNYLRNETDDVLVKTNHVHTNLIFNRSRTRLLVRIKLFHKTNVRLSSIECFEEEICSHLVLTSD